MRLATCAAALFLSAVSSMQPSLATQHQPVKSNPLDSKHRPAAYASDGTPIATGAPRRLSPLAGKDSVAWAAVHSARAKHKQRVAIKPGRQI
jgi:hypothetical protein